MQLIQSIHVESDSTSLTIHHPGSMEKQTKQDRKTPLENQLRQVHVGPVLGIRKQNFCYCEQIHLFECNKLRIQDGIFWHPLIRTCKLSPSHPKKITMTLTMQVLVTLTNYPEPFAAPELPHLHLHSLNQGMHS